MYILAINQEVTLLIISMLILLLLTLFGFILSVILSPFPTITELPFGVDSALTTAAGYFNAFRTLFWPFNDLWLFVLAYLSIHVILLILKFFLGHRIR